MLPLLLWSEVKNFSVNPKIAFPLLTLGPITFLVPLLSLSDMT